MPQIKHTPKRISEKIVAPSANKIIDDKENKLDEAEQEFLDTFKRDKGHSLRTLLGLYKGHYVDLFFSIVFFVIKHSPVWALPIVTSNVINAATEGGAGAVHTIIINVAIMAALVLQNIPTNYVHTWLYAKTIRVMELELRSALVRKLQQLFHQLSQRHAERTASVKDYARRGAD